MVNPSVRPTRGANSCLTSGLDIAVWLELLQLRRWKGRIVEKGGESRLYFCCGAV